jgi:tRNA-dihydrouridine synthase A
MPKNPAETPEVEKPIKQAVFAESSREKLSREVSVAPMMDRTDRHCRYFLRGFGAHTLLYTEMITAAAILRGNRERLLAFNPEEHPVALQLGGSDPKDLAQAAEAGEAFGYDEINLNCGCPSDRVHSGAFGACLMLEPQKVGECVAAMRARVRIPVTVKMRIGVVVGRGREASEAVAKFTDDDYAALHQFIRIIRDAGSDAAIVHARKAVLGGLSPKDNREVPPLRYDVVERVAKDFPSLPVVVNGGVRDTQTALSMLSWSRGVMLGREAYHRPIVLAELHRALFPDDANASNAGFSRGEMLERMARYAEREVARGERLPSITRHMLGLFSGEAGAKEYRRMLSEGARAYEAGPSLIRKVGSELGVVASARRP